MNKIRSSQKKDYYISLGLALLGCTLIFMIIELKYPYFFLRDDNAGGSIAGYVAINKSLAEGKFPLYWFSSFCGGRWFASGQTGLLNPLVIVSELISRLICGKPDMMIDIIAYLSIIIGCTGSFMLLKKLGCSDVAAIIGSIAWNFNAYNIWVGTSWIIVVNATSIFPFFMLTSVMLLERSTIRRMILAIIPRVYMFYLGHPQFFIYSAIFDCIFTGVLCLLKEGKHPLRSLLILIRDYFFAYLMVTFLALPLLIPEYQFTQLTYDFSSAKTYDALLDEMWFEVPAFFFPYLYSENTNSNFYPPYIGLLLFACLIAGFFLLIFMLDKKYYSKLKAYRNSMIAAIPCLSICALLLFTYAGLKIISFIPILNRFHYYHRISIFMSSFAVIFACLSMSAIGSLLKEKFKTGPRKASVISYVLICVEILSFSLLYTLTPRMGRGVLYDTSKLYDYKFAEQFKGGRYITAGYHVDNRTVNKTVYDLSENLNYSLSSLYGINNVSGYAGFLNYRDVIYYNEFFGHIFAIQGSLHQYYPGLIEQMREQSVCWYIVNPEKKDVYEHHFKEYGLKYVSETEHSVIYYDPNAQPYAYDPNGKEVLLAEDVNTLTLHTDNGFAGGNITLNYTYDPNFKCYIDGKPAGITNEPEKWQFKVECGPGEHEIVIRYEDPVLIACCAVSCGYTIAAGLAAILFTKVKKRKQQAGNT